MDLSRAKTVLICAFLILNVFLSHQIWQDEGLGAWRLLEQEDISRLETALQDANLALEVTLPRSSTHLAHLIVEPWRPQAKDIIAAVWYALENGEAYPTVWQEPNNPNNGDFDFVYHFKGYDLSVKKEGTLSLKGLNIKKNDNTTPDEMKEIAHKLTNTIPFLDVFIFDHIKKNKQGTVINYRQEYGEFPLYAGYLQVREDEQGKIGLLLYRLDPLGFAEQKRGIIPPSKALLRFLDVYDCKDEETSIVEFSLGYYSREYDAQRWEIPPVWRIRLGNGEIYYINSFTGHLES